MKHLCLAADLLPGPALAGAGNRFINLNRTTPGPGRLTVRKTEPTSPRPSNKPHPSTAIQAELLLLKARARPTRKGHRRSGPVRHRGPRGLAPATTFGQAARFPETRPGISQVALPLPLSVLQQPDGSRPLPCLL